VVELEADVRRWINVWNADPKPFIWTEPVDQILDTLAAYCQLITTHDTNATSPSRQLHALFEGC
jgi:hypothetical protein